MPFSDTELDFMLKSAGTTGTATVDGQALTFYGVYSANSRIEHDTAGLAYEVEGTSFTVRTTMATTLPKQTVVTINGTQYRITDKRAIDDGSLTRLLIAPET